MAILSVLYILSIFPNCSKCASRIFALPWLLLLLQVSCCCSCLHRTCVDPGCILLGWIAHGDRIGLDNGRQQGNSGPHLPLHHIPNVRKTPVRSLTRSFISPLFFFPLFLFFRPFLIFLSIVLILVMIGWEGEASRGSRLFLDPPISPHLFSSVLLFFRLCLNGVVFGSFALSVRLAPFHTPSLSQSRPVPPNVGCRTSIFEDITLCLRLRWWFGDRWCWYLFVIDFPFSLLFFFFAVFCVCLSSPSIG